MHSERSGAVSGAATDLPDGRRTVASRVDGMKTLAGALGQLPVTVRFWDGSAVVARDDPDAPVVLIRDERAIAHFLRAPNQLGLGRAWVSGALDVDGDLERVLGLRRRVGELRSSGACERARLAAAAVRVAGPRALRRPPIPESEAAPGGAAALAAARPRRGAPSLRRLEHASTSSCSGRAWSTRARTSRREADSLERAQERKLELICRKLRLQPGERLLDIGCGWGSLRPPRRGAPRRARASASRSRSRRRSSRASASPPPGWATASRSACRLPRARRAAVRQDRQRRHVRARRPRAARHLRRHRAAAAAPGRAVPQPRHHPHPLRARRAARRSSAATSSPTASCTR